ncbi:MAG TPA: thioesterase family protein [Thermodesulfobacteriota bacterium]|nr:thioesterase family protein [Thermodesulfobacteriota bacterium]
MTPMRHQTETRVAYAEIDAMGIAYYANYLRWFEVGRTEFMRSLGIAYKEMEEQGTFLPVSEVFCKYQVPARYDDVLIIETSVDFLKRASIQFAYRVLRKSDGIELVTGSTLHAFVDQKGRIVKVPAALRAKLNR